MAITQPKPEEFVVKLRQVEILSGQGMPRLDAIRQIGVTDKHIERLWRCEGLKVPTKQPKKARLWTSDGSCVRLRPECRDHVCFSDM